MAAGIALLCLENELNVVAKARSAAAAEKLASAVSKQLAKKMDDAQASSTAKRFSTTLAPSGLSGCQIVVEAVAEDLAIKQKLFSELDAVLPPNIVLASNTSSLSIKEIAANCRHKERVAGMHFFNPVSKMQLVEVVKTNETNDEAEKTISELAHQLGKTPITVKDSPGFIVNRLLMPFLNDAVRLVEEGVSEPATIDSAVKLGLNHPMGPLALVDLIGIDVFVEIMRELQRKTGDKSFAPRPLALKLLNEGKLGRKTGEGFYKY
ncbi:hypothetical protein AUJ14_02850 [Candidatus Micrarchaeota archaeon CG1_02_55_22]|nr:MAG: hypothetical protein AUJ14_02850 [Candidatus Micrarchaeota archaeon CG1_02_55_22]